MKNINLIKAIILLQEIQNFINKKVKLKKIFSKKYEYLYDKKIKD